MPGARLPDPGWYESSKTISPQASGPLFVGRTSTEHRAPEDPAPDVTIERLSVSMRWPTVALARPLLVARNRSDPLSVARSLGLVGVVEQLPAAVGSQPTHGWQGRQQPGPADGLILRQEVSTPCGGTCRCAPSRARRTRRRRCRWSRPRRGGTARCRGPRSPRNADAWPGSRRSGRSAPPPVGGARGVLPGACLARAGRERGHADHPLEGEAPGHGRSGGLTPVGVVHAHARPPLGDGPERGRRDRRCTVIRPRSVVRSLLRSNGRARR